MFFLLCNLIVPLEDQNLLLHKIKAQSGVKVSLCLPFSLSSEHILGNLEGT